MSRFFFGKEIKTLNFKHMKQIILPLLLVFIVSCGDDGYNSGNSDSLQNNVDIAYETAVQVFYSLPSPIETAMVIENTNVEFSDDYILPLNAADLYETSTEKAVNLGVYCTDLSYLTMFNQTQASIEYLSVCKKLSEELGLLNVIEDSVLVEIQNNLKNRDEVMSLISEQFMHINAYLEENDRGESATLIVFGGWIEGLYLSTMLVGDNVENNPDLIQMIYDQKISLENLISLLEIYRDNDDIEHFLNEINELKSIYDNISYPISQENFEQIVAKVELTRNSFTKISF